MANKEFEPGAKVKYIDNSKTVRGVHEWRNGVVHGVRKVDDVHGIARVLTYIIDTGGDIRVDVIRHSLRSQLHRKEYLKHVGNGLKHEEAIKKAQEAAEKIPDEFYEEKIRQPEQVDVPPESVRAR